MIFFLAKHGDQPSGRIAGIVDHHYVEFQQEKTGFFGFFESVEDPEVTQALLAPVQIGWGGTAWQR